MEKGWIKIYETTNYYRAELLRQALEANGIKTVLMNKQDSAYKAFGKIELLIHHDFEEAAKTIIDSINDEEE